MKIFPFIFLIAITALVVTLFTKGIFHTIILSVGIGIILYITKAIWLPEGYKRYAVRLVSLGIALSAAFSFGFWPRLFENIIKAAIETHFPGFAAKYPIIEASPYLVFAFLSIVIWTVNYFNRDNTAMGIHPKPIAKDIPDITFKERLKNVCISLSDDLRSIDIKTNWSAQYFTPLDAEVEVNTKNRKKKKIMDLLDAIKKSDDRLFLVLGDPGSGKSVALRKLAQDLSKEAVKTGKIPVYINLKEWSIENKWDENHPPTVQQLQDFVVNNLKSRDIVTSKFFDKFFDPLYETGRLYFILDSFDEIPAVLDEQENSELIHQLSEVIFKFLKGARAVSSQGILSSRIFRKPTQEFQVKTILEIRPFTEAKIIETLKRSGQFSEGLVHLLFKERVELVPVARNPFSATLISEYAEHNNNQLPANQTEMYSSYIEITLDSCMDRIERRNLSKEAIIDCSIEIADKMFQKYGLEAPVSELRREISRYPVDDVIDVLKFARLGRGGISDENRFSFVHRRFTEYFAVQEIIADVKMIDMESIPTDSQWRDALVLYCEVAEESKATAIAEFCWNMIKTTDDPQDLRVIHCMRFLRDAFKGRLECIQSFRGDLAEYIYAHIDEDSNMISLKLAVETVGLLEDKDIDRCIVKAMDLGNSWINETAFKSCRHLPKLSKGLEKKIIKYLDSILLNDLFKQKNELRFSLSLSDGFKKVKTFLNFKLLNSLIIFLSSSIFIFFISKFLFVFWSILLISLIYFSFPPTNASFLFLMLVAFFLIIEPEKNEKFIELLRAFFNVKNPNPFLFLLVIISLPFYSILKFDWKGIYKKMIKIKKNDFLVMLRIAGNLTILITIALIGCYLYKKFEKIFSVIEDFLLRPFEIVISIGVLIFFVYFLRNYCQDQKKLTKLNFDKTWNRNGIYNTFKSLKLNSGKLKFVKLLEANVKEVEGEWPDNDILKVSNEESHIRLAQLEEKWLGISR